uniref:ARAD1A03432p n=1 Tax=Blastobotrys adeninivorans TaxID=409370 RepID=A0A060T203_BLAAD
MPPKRPKDNGRWDSKRIRVQNADPALADGRMDVRVFANARNDEVRQIEDAMERSRNSSKQRAFQTVPRTLRRRTASHQPNRVPKRLRKRAKKEMAADNTPETGGPKHHRGHERALKMAMERVHQRDKSLKRFETGNGREETESTTDFVDYTGLSKWNDPPTGRLSYYKRQKSKVWLPTHVWHAKRAHMVSRWGFAIAKTPTQKCYRSTHRALAQSGCVAWDTSYMNTVILSGSRQQLIDFFNHTFRVHLPQNCIDGQYVWNGLLYNAESCIGPATVYWNPGGSESENHLMLRFHPAMFNSGVKEAITQSGLDFQDCRYSIGSISVQGPKSLNALNALLRLSKFSKTNDPRLSNRWDFVGAIATANSIPSGSVIVMETIDPRFSSPKSHKPSKPTTNQIVDLLESWPDGLTGPSNIFTPQGRELSYRNQATIKRLHERIRDAGKDEPIPLEKDDPVVPIVVYRTSGSWNVVLPWGWVLPFWHSLIQISGVQLGGLDQVRQLKYEFGELYFPNDYVFTPSGMEEVLAQSAEDKREWDKRPVANRTNYDSTAIWSDGGKGEIGNPFLCDWPLMHALRSKLQSDSSEQEQREFSRVDHQQLRNYPGLDDAVPVQVTCVHRGVPLHNARIYRVPRETAAHWEKVFNAPDHSEMTTPCPLPRDLIGFVSTGSFNMRQARGTGIGCVVDASSEKCLIRNPGTSVVRPATLTRLTVTN